MSVFTNHADIEYRHPVGSNQNNRKLASNPWNKSFLLVQISADRPRCRSYKASDMKVITYINDLMRGLSRSLDNPDELRPSESQTSPGLACRSSATQPANSGAAIDVPSSVLYPPRGSGYVLTCTINYSSHSDTQQAMDEGNSAVNELNTYFDTEAVITSSSCPMVMIVTMEEGEE